MSEKTKQLTENDKIQIRLEKWNKENYKEDEKNN